MDSDPPRAESDSIGAKVYRASPIVAADRTIRERTCASEMFSDELAIGEELR
jgi:hypothetical protein